MTILRVIVSMDPSYGGPCQGIRNSIPELTKLGVHNEVVCLDPEGTLYPDPFPIHTLGTNKDPWHYSSKLLPWLLNNLSRFDAVIVHGLWLYPSYAVWRAIRLCNKNEQTPLLTYFVMPHGMLDPYFQKASDRRLKALRNRIYWQLIERKVIRDAKALLFTCEAELVLARESFPHYSPKQEINVGYGIAEPPIYEAQLKCLFIDTYPVLSKLPYLLFLSRIHKKKGIDILLEAYATLLEGNPYAPDAIPLLVIAGPGIESAFGKKLKEMVNKRDALRDKVIFTGMLTGHIKWSAFYNCEAFILPSHQENFGISVVEALACKKPVLISNQVNIWREVEHAKGGIIAQDSVEGVKRLLHAWLVSTKEEQNTMGRNARFCFESHFAIQPAADRLLCALQGNDIASKSSF